MEENKRQSHNQYTKEPVPDHEDYGGIGIEEFSRRVEADMRERYGSLLRNAVWVPVGEPGW